MASAEAYKKTQRQQIAGQQQQQQKKQIQEATKTIDDDLSTFSLVPGLGDPGVPGVGVPGAGPGAPVVAPQQVNVVMGEDDESDEEKKSNDDDDWEAIKNAS